MPRSEAQLQAGRRYVDKSRQLVRDRNNAYRLDNLEYFRNYMGLPHREDPNFPLAHSVRRRLYNALRRQSLQASARLVKYLGRTVGDLRAHSEAKFETGMSWENCGSWHIDHIKPMSGLDLSDSSQRAVAAHYTNLRPLWAQDNLRKSNKVAE